MLLSHQQLIQQPLNSRGFLNFHCLIYVHQVIRSLCTHPYLTQADLASHACGLPTKQNDRNWNSNLYQSTTSIEWKNRAKEGVVRLSVFLTLLTSTSSTLYISAAVNFWPPNMTTCHSSLKPSHYRIGNLKAGWLIVWKPHKRHCTTESIFLQVKYGLSWAAAQKL